MKVDKKKYEKLELPENLSELVDNAIQDGKRESYIQIQKKIRVRNAIAVAACMMLCFVVLINTSESFAEGIRSIPVISKIGEYFDFKHKEENDEYKLLNVSYPELKNIENKKLQNKVNNEIAKFVNEVVGEYECHAKERYDAILATGGSEEDFIPFDIVIDYEIKCCNERFISFVVYGWEMTASYYSVQKYYTIDLEEGVELTIRDVLGNDYVNIVENAVKNESKNWDIQRRELLWDNIDYAEILNDESNYYIDEQGQVYVVFNKYEIAAGAAGIIEVRVGYFE